MPSRRPFSTLAPACAGRAERRGRPAGAVRALLLLVAAAVAAGCFRSVPVLPERIDPPGERIVVLVPGITGSVIEDRESGEILWGNAARVLRPHDGGHALALPVPPAEGGSKPLPPTSDAVEVIRQIDLLPGWSSPVYQPIVSVFEKHGFRAANLLEPDSIPPRGDVLLTFPYDWRRDNLEATRSLARGLEELARVREAPVEVTLLCQSNGGHLCRYVARYGAATLAEAEAGTAGPPAGVTLTDMILVGTSNGGSLRILRELNRGRRYAPPVGRTIAPETLFTFPSLYQDLPVCWDDLFADLAGRPLDVDLFSADSWEERGWSVYSRRSRRRIERGRVPAGFGTPEDRRAFLERSLDRAKRFHRLLAVDPPGYRPPLLHLIQSHNLDTPVRALLATDRRGRPHTYFTGDRRIDREFFRSRIATAPGDGHASEKSQLCVSPAERKSLAGETVYVRGAHFKMILTEEALRTMVEIATRPR